MKIHFTLKAKDKLFDIYQFYKDKSQGKTGRQIRANIIDKIMALKDYPLLGVEDEQLKSLGMGYLFL